ncbi:MAG TPA: hypothetical protein VNQ79_11800 [Blastocatellia bacterium]|nr:hypothetical protein [Blastocatellia bacterium]
MAAERDELFDDEEKEPKIIVQKKLPPQTETMDLPEKEQKQKMPKKKKESPPEAAPATAPEQKAAEKPAPKPKPAASHAAKKMRPVSISEDTYWAIRKKLVDLRKETPVDEVLEEAVRLWIRHKSG